MKTQASIMYNGFVLHTVGYALNWSEMGPFAIIDMGLGRGRKCHSLPECKLAVQRLRTVAVATVKTGNRLSHEHR